MKNKIVFHAWEFLQFIVHQWCFIDIENMTISIIKGTYSAE